MLDYEFENPAWEAIAQLDLDDIKEHNVPGYKLGEDYRPLHFHLLRKVTLGKILDFGCGIGRNFPTLVSRCKHLVGYDLPAMIDACRRYANRKGSMTLTADWSTIEKDRFDLVVASFVFQHIPYGEARRNLLKRLAGRCTRLYIISRNWGDDDRGSIYQDILDSGLWDLVECTHDAEELRKIGDEDISFEALFVTKDEEQLKWASPRVMEGVVPRPNLSPAVGWKANIAMAQLFTKNYDEFAYTVVDHNKRYSDRHGYKYFYRTKLYENYLNRHPSWHRIPYVLELFDQQDVEWVFWTDIDSVIMRPEIPLETHLYRHQDKDMVLCDQGHGFVDGEVTDSCICFGQFFLRNCEWSKDFLNAIWSFVNDDKYKKYLKEPCWEQEAVNHLYKSNYMDVQDHAAVVPNREFNSFNAIQYVPGDFMIHFAGVRDPKIISKLTRTYLSKLPGEQRTYIEELPDRDALSKYLPKGGIGIELGVERGLHAESLFKYAEPKELHLVDFWSYNGNREGFSDWLGYKEEVVNKFGREPAVTIYDSPIEDIVPTFPDSYFDWIYIDSWHSYRTVKKDITLALPKLKVGGYLCGHDFDIDPSDWNTGPPRAVIETIQNEGLRMVALSNESQGDWVLRKVVKK